MSEITYEQQIDSTLSRECFYAETDTECGLCSRPNCTHYCHTDQYKFWRAADNLAAFILLKGTKVGGCNMVSYPTGAKARGVAAGAEETFREEDFDGGEAEDVYEDPYGYDVEEDADQD